MIYILLIFQVALVLGVVLLTLGFLITKELGPRARIFAVTTDLPLIADHPVDIGIKDFCSFCKKMGSPPFFSDG